MRKICFRFDVDTHKCAAVGVPNLLRLAREKEVKFTFFVNCGRAISLPDSIRAKFRRQKSSSVHYPALGALRKLGWLEFVRCALLNPEILKSYSSFFVEAARDAHEVGLHGGRNHESWMRNVNQWSDEIISEEIRWGIEKLRGIGVEPHVFASPGAEGGERVRKILGDFPNFRFLSDDLDPHRHFPDFKKGLILDLPTALCGPGKVAYIEHLVAQGRSPQQIADHFRSRLQEADASILYDHPYFAGAEALPILSSLIDVAREENISICTLGEIGEDFARIGKEDEANRFPRA